VALPKLHHDIKEIHAIELKLVAEAHFWLHVREIFVGCDICDDIEHDFLAFFFGHGGG
jgi:hypothetical protein